MGDVDRALEAFVDGAAAGDQGVALGFAVGVHRPVNLTVIGLQGEYEAYRPLDRGPQLLEKIALAGHQVVVPHAGGDVGDEIALAPLTVVDLLSPVGGPPAAIRQLHPGQPGISPAGRPVLAADGQPHGCLHVIPGIGVAAIKPGNFATGQLGVEDKLHRWPQELVGKQPPAQIQAAHNEAPLRKYITTLLPMTGFIIFSSARVTAGCSMMSHTSRR